MTTVYISGQMRGRPEYNREAFIEVERAFREHFIDNTSVSDDLTILNPTHNFDGEQGLPTTTYMNLDLTQVLEADVIVQICGTDEFGGHWQVSEGAYREAQLGVWAGKRFIEARLRNHSMTDMGRATDWDFVQVTTPNFSHSVRASVLDEAKQLITGDRNNAYGPPTQDFDRTAGMASAFGFQVNGQPLQSHHVAIFMMLLKISRLAWTPAKRDSWVDASGYAGCGAECAGVK